jgi:hypothetical protein
MKLFNTLAVAVFSLGLFAMHPGAIAAPKKVTARAVIQQVLHKKPATRIAEVQSSPKKANFFQRMASKPRAFFQKGTVEARARNEGVPPEAYVNVPRPVVSENSIF